MPTQEERLIATMITRKPHKMSFMVAAGTVMIMGLSTQLYWNNSFGLSHLLPAVNQEIFGAGQWWRVFTAILIHADFGHFLSNMYMLGIFSFFVFGYFGFGIYPVLSFFSAGVVNALAVSTYPADVRLLGASGLVYLLGGFWLTLYFLIQRQYELLNRSLRVIGIGLMIFVPTTFVPTTSYRTHAIGFAAGITLGCFYFYKNLKKIRSHEVYKVQLIEPTDSENLA